MKTKERIVHFYELYLHTLSLDKEIQNPFATDMLTMLAALNKHIKKGQEIGANKNIEIIDFDFDEKKSTLIFLLNRPDPDLSDVTYKDKKTKTRRNGNKTATEAIEISSHVIITAIHGEAIAEVRMTMGAGIYADRIVVLLNDIYDTNKKTSKALKNLGTRAHPTNAIDDKNQPITYQVRHRFEQKSLPNVWLKDILNNGKVQGIELIENGHKEFDTTQPHDIIKRTLEIKPNTGLFSLDSIKKLFGIALKNHNLNADHVRIKYKSENGEDSSKLFAQNQLDSAFTRSEKIELDTDHNQQQPAISKEIIAKMQAIP